MTWALAWLCLVLLALHAGRWWRDRRDSQAAARARALAWRETNRLANEASIDKERRAVVIPMRPFSRVCEACGAPFERNPIVVDMRCDACQANAFDETLESDRDDWSKGGEVVASGFMAGPGKPIACHHGKEIDVKPPCEDCIAETARLFNPGKYML